MPTARPAVLRFHATVPLPVPFPVVSVVQAFRLVAVQAVVDAPVPERVTEAVEPATAAPCCALMRRDPGLTASVSGNGAAVITSVSITRVGEPVAPAAVTVIVSTYVPTASPVVLRLQATVPVPVPDAVVSVVQSIGEPRYPSFMGIRKASKANIPVWSLSDLGTNAPEPVVKRSELMNPPVKETSIEIITGESPAEIADKLVDKIIAEKIL